MSLINSIFRKINRYSPSKKFDAKFYLSHYDDLKNLKNKKAALKHYVTFGRSEGRFPNAKLYSSSQKILKNDLLSNFDLIAYKHFNKDLSSHFVADHEFFEHYVRHGHQEGRKCRFDNDEEMVPEIVRPDEKWKSIFSTSEFIAFCGEYLDKLPENKQEAIEIFIEIGIEKLWPISFSYSFDVNFIRENNILSDIKNVSDSDMYRFWLTKGFPNGKPANERMFLFSYLGGLPFPLNFDWHSYIRRSNLPSSTTRSQALILLFNEPSRKIIQHMDLMGDDAGWLLDCIGRRALIHGEHSKAATIFTQATNIITSAETLCFLGDSHRAMGATNDALTAYLSSIEIGRAPIWSYLHAANIYADRGDFSSAFNVMYQAAGNWRQKTEFSDKVIELSQRYFDYQSSRAHSLYRETLEKEPIQVDRSKIDKLLTTTLDEIQNFYLNLLDLPNNFLRSDGYISILANDDLRQCTHYRVEQKEFQLLNAGIDVKIFSHHNVKEFVESLIGASSAIFYRVAATPNILLAIIKANRMGIDTYYEIDDLIFDSSAYPDSFESFEGQITPSEYAGLQFGVPLFRYAMAQCKKSIASTPALADLMREITQIPESILIRNALDERNSSAITMGHLPIRSPDGRCRIFYGSGTKAHNADFNKLVGPALLSLMQRYSHVDLIIVGHLKLMPEFEEMSDRIVTHSFIPDVTTYWSILAGCDINIAVLEPGIVADCKSEIKWLEAAILQIPSVVSGTRTYREIIIEGRDGFIADTPEDWSTTLELLINNPELRNSVGRDARKKALENYAIDVASSTLKNVFFSEKEINIKRKTTKIKILICNVFYSPQSYGGATRVVEENIKILKEKYKDLDIAVFCTEDGSSPPGVLKISSVNNIPVYRLHTPQEEHMDWRPFNESHAEKFEQVIDQFKPDIIHFHCIQRLTATIVEVALKHNIPYLVTLHDAWWISDNQFLIDTDGLLKLPSCDPLSDSKNSIHGLPSITRRQRLASLLQHSQANLSVSAPFADIYRNAGITKVQVIENGSPAIERTAHIPRADGRIALGHIGGRSAHKGASLLEAALRRGNYNNLHLTMVDGTLSVGQSIDTIWGNTPVTMTAPFPQSQIAQLYARLNVLLAPSTWPESYGLVTREALSSGLWVVASNLGAIGQDIIEDENGYVVDVQTTRELQDILTKIDGNPERYLNSPSYACQSIRTMTDQADDLYGIYTRMFQSRDV